MLKQYSILFIIISLTNNSFSQENNIMFSSDRLILGVSKERTASVSSGDIDNDGDQDIIIANGRHWPGQNKIFINDGRGIFTIEKNLGAQRSTTYAAELGDFDLDGDLDIAVGNDMAPNYIYTNNGNGDFIKTSSFGKRYSRTRNITLSDIDNDGDIDILITNRTEPNEICINNGQGEFIENFSFGSKDDATIDVEIADMNLSLIHI